MSVQPETYSIGIYEGKSPFDLKSREGNLNPIVSRTTLKDSNVNFCADPFGVLHLGKWYLFFEVMPKNSRKGKIYVTTSVDLREWSDAELVLEEPFHLSYPQIVRYEDDFYMIPETYEANEVRLYRSTSFPNGWEYSRTLLSISCVDSTLYYDNQNWWMFTCDAPSEHNQLRLYYAQDLFGDWTEHKNSPIYTNDNSRSRPGGKLFHYKGKRYRLSQECNPFYGYSLNAFEIVKMTTNEYVEIELKDNPILQKGSELWNRISMHHMDLHEVASGEFMAFVDGRAN